MNAENCNQCIYGEAGSCEFWSDRYSQQNVCPRFNPGKTEGMELKGMTDIRRMDIEKAIVATRVLMGNLTLNKKMRVIIDYDPQETTVHVDFFAMRD